MNAYSYAYIARRCHDYNKHQQSIPSSMCAVQFPVFTTRTGPQLLDETSNVILYHVQVRRNLTHFVQYTSTPHGIRRPSNSSRRPDFGGLSINAPSYLELTSKFSHSTASSCAFRPAKLYHVFEKMQATGTRLIWLSVNYVGVGFNALKSAKPCWLG